VKNAANNRSNMVVVKLSVYTSAVINLCV